MHQGKVSHWKDMPPTKQMPNCGMPPGNLCPNNNPCAPHAGPGMIRLPQVGTNINKTDSAWMKNQTLNRNLNWSEVPSHRDPSGHRIWDDIHNPIQDKNVPGTPNTPNSAFGNWGDSGHPMGSYWGSKSKNPNSNWADGQVDTSSWGGPLKQVCFTFNIYCSTHVFTENFAFSYIIWPILQSPKAILCQSIFLKKYSVIQFDILQKEL